MIENNKWFGEAWNSHCCTPENHAPTPIGIKCTRCSNAIKKGDQGLIMPGFTESGVECIVYHIDCFLKSIGISPSSK